jgi:hypothetical protein
MITFRSSATGPVQMLDAHGAQLLAALGRDNSTRGAIMPEQMDEAISRLQQASAESAAAERADAVAQGEQDAAEFDQQAPISLGQRAFPLLQMLKIARNAGEPVLWGV